MGSLAGHVVPGSFFLIYGIAWVILAMCIHLKMRTHLGHSMNRKQREGSSNTLASTSFFKLKRDQGLSRKSWLPLPCIPRLPLEPILKIVFSALGIIVELFLAIVKYEDGNGSHVVTKVYHIFNEDGSFNGMGKLHHATMYSAFLLSGVVDILTIFVKFPHQTSPFFLSIAFLIEGILFYFHTHGRDVLNVHAHFLLTLVISACVFFSLLRVFIATNFVINLGLACSIVFQGTWFVHAGYILYPPGGNDKTEDKKNYGMYMSACFTWHIMGIAGAMLIMWVILLCLMRSGVARCVSKRSRLSRSRNWAKIEESERLIADDSLDKSSRHKAISQDEVTIEMHQMFETETTGALLNETGEVDSISENRV